MQWRIPEPLATAEVPLVDGSTIVLRQHGNANGPRLVISHANGLSVDAYFPFWSLLSENALTSSSTTFAATAPTRRAT